MTATILRFPKMEKSVVIERCGDGVRVHMTPAETDREKQVWLVFDEVEHARAYAKELTLTWGDCFRRIIDNTMSAGGA